MDYRQLREHARTRLGALEAGADQARRELVQAEADYRLAKERYDHALGNVLECQTWDGILGTFGQEAEERAAKAKKVEEMEVQNAKDATDLLSGRRSGD